MDRSEALKLLTGGKFQIVEKWNRQRESGEVIPDLRGADLSYQDLSNADLRGANLRGANLSGADLTMADLTNADLRGANLIEADLREADLTNADLREADLTNAELPGADLRGADLTNAELPGAVLYGGDLSEANLSETTCWGTSFANVDLSTVKGLDSVRHQGPSTIGADTLFRSKGMIPEAFLRGAGLPPTLIEYLPSLIGSMAPIQFYSCFISHSSKDQVFADQLHSRMVQEKLRVWYAPQDMRGGRKSIDQIDQAIRVHDKLLLVLSKDSMASDWVLHEIGRAVERERREKRQVLFPIGLASWEDIKAWTAFDSDMGKDLAKVVREYHILDFSEWKDYDSFETAFARLLKDLKAEESVGQSALPGPSSGATPP
jgi:hypothetical protein